MGTGNISPNEKGNRRGSIGLYGPVLVLWLCLWLALLVCRAWEPIRGYGDYTSDACAVIAGRNLYAHGFNSLHFLGVNYPVVLDRPVPAGDYYTHYPPAGTVIKGALDCLGLGHIGYARSLAALASSLGLWFLYGAVVRVTNRPDTAVATVILLSISPFFFPYADSFFQTGYLNAFLFGTILYYLCRIDLGPRDSRFPPPVGLSVGWVLVFLQSWVSYEGTPFIITFVLLHSALISRRSAAWVVTAVSVLTSAVVAFLVLHRLQVAWALGSHAAAWKDLAGSFSGEATAAVRRFDVLKMVYWVCSPLNVVTAVVLGWHLRFGGHACPRSGSSLHGGGGLLLAACLIGCALPWAVVFRYHFLHETSKDYRHFAVGLSLALAVVLTRSFERGHRRLCVALTAAVLVLASVLETVNIVVPRSKPGWENLAVVDRIVPRRSLILANYQGYAPMVYTQRPQIEGCAGPDDVERVFADSAPLLAMYDAVYLLLIDNPCFDSPVLYNVTKDYGLRYAHGLGQYLPVRLRQAISAASADGPGSTARLTRFVAKDRRFEHVIDIPSANAQLFRVVHLGRG
jgi:hypothetical protein